VKSVKNVELLGTWLAITDAMETLQGSAHARDVIACAIEVHKGLGPGLLESAYGHCLAYELTTRGISFLREYELPVRYKGKTFGLGYRVDFVVGNDLLVEIKSVDALNAIHHAQMLTYLKLADIEHGLLINFNARVVKNGIKSLLLRSEPRD
jgi:GxxExxY protein